MKYEIFNNKNPTTASSNRANPWKRPVEKNILNGLNSADNFAYNWTTSILKNSISLENSWWNSTFFTKIIIDNSYIIENYSLWQQTGLGRQSNRDSLLEIATRKLKTIKTKWINTHSLKINKTTNDSFFDAEFIIVNLFVNRQKRKVGIPLLRIWRHVNIVRASKCEDAILIDPRDDNNFVNVYTASKLFIYSVQ